MSSKTINTILNLQDKMSPKLLKVSDRVKGLDKDTQRATLRMSNMANKFTTSVNTMATKATKFAAIGTTLAGAFAIKTGFGEAMDMEGFRTQLETATKSAKKAGQIMKWSVDLANKTPFEAGPVIEMASKYEAMGLSAKKWGSITADMAGGTNKDIIQATEAVIDAQTGELERLKEFGITKAKIAEKANKMFAGQEIINAKGQITDQEKFNAALMGLMEDRFKGGAAALSKSTKGMWSTVTGVTKTSLANLVGMQNDGTIKSGSMLDKLKGKVAQLADRLTKWQNDGTLERIGAKLTAAFTTIYNAIAKVYNFFKKYQDIIIFLGTFVATLFVVVKAFNALKTVLLVVRIAALLLNGTLVLSPFGLVALAIAGLVAGLVILHKKFGSVSNAVSALWSWFKKLISGVPDAALALAGPIAPLLLLIKHFDKVKEAIKGAFGWLKKFGTSDVKTSTSKDSEKQSTWQAKHGRNALGTSYWKGGPTSLNERGGEIVDLPNGSRVIPADKSKKITNNRSVNFTGNIYVTAKGITTDEVVNEFVSELKLKMANL